MSMTGVMDIVWHEKKPDRILFQGKVRLAQLRGAVVRGASRRFAAVKARQPRHGRTAAHNGHSGQLVLHGRLSPQLSKPSVQ